MPIPAAMVTSVRLLAALGCFLLAAGLVPESPSVRAGVATAGSKPEPSAEAPVEEGTLQEFFHDKVVEAEERASKAVKDAGEAVEQTEEEVYKAITGEEKDPFEEQDTHASRHRDDAPESLDFHLHKGYPFIEYTGYLEKVAGREPALMDLHKGMMTLSEAKDWCAEHKECQGFSHAGEAGKGPFLMTFKDYWELNVDAQEAHTAYKKEAKLEEGAVSNMKEMFAVDSEEATVESGEADRQFTEEEMADAVEKDAHDLSHLNSSFFGGSTHKPGKEL